MNSNNIVNKSASYTQEYPHIVNCLITLSTVLTCTLIISKNFPNTPIEFIYDATGRWFTPLMILGQMFLPFYVVYGVTKKFESIKSERRELAEKEA